MNLIYNEDFFAEIVNDFYYMFDRVLNTPLNSVASTVEKMQRDYSKYFIKLLYE